MSNRLLTLAWSVPLASGSKLLLVALADRASDEGRSWPSVAILTAQTGLSTASITRHMSDLVGRGLVTQRRRRQRSAEYVVVEDAMRAAAEVLAEVVELPAQPQSPQPDSTQPDSTQDDGSRFKNNHPVDQESSNCVIPKENPHRTLKETSSKRPRTTGDRHFDAFWAAYPKRGGKNMAKDDARKAWLSVLKAIAKPDDDGIAWTVEQVIDGARRYGRECESLADRGFVRMPATWLRAGGWKYDDDSLTIRDPAEWLRDQWKARRVTEIHKHYRVGYDPPSGGDGNYLEDVLKPYNRRWIEQHHDAILARFTSEAS